MADVIYNNANTFLEIYKPNIHRKYAVIRSMETKTYLKIFGVDPVVVVGVDDEVAPVVAVPDDAVVLGTEAPQGFGNGDVFSAPRCGFSSTLLPDPT